MPPRSATRKKSTWKSKQSELELSLADQSNTVPESENKVQEALSAAVKDEGGEQVAPLVIAGVEIKQELRVLDSNYADRAVMSTAVKTKVKEEERNVNVNTVSFMEDGERMEGDHDKFDNAADEKEVKGEQKEGIHVGVEDPMLEEVDVAVGDIAADIAAEEIYPPEPELPSLRVRPFDSATYHPRTHVMVPGGMLRFDDFEQGAPEDFLLRERTSHLSHDASEADAYAWRGYGAVTARDWYQELPARVREMVDEAGFGLFCSGLSRLQASRPLLGALVERWWDTTNSFHFSSTGEMTMTPYDFSMITGLRVGGDPIPFDLDMGQWRAAWVYLLGAHPPLAKPSMVRYSWFYDHFHGSQPETQEQVEQYTRGFLIYLLGTTLFANRWNTVGLYLLSALVVLPRVRDYDWGGAGLATLYIYMSSSSRKKGNMVGGYWRAWDLWVYAYFPTLAPVPRDEVAAVVPHSRLYDGKCYPRPRSVTTFAYYRRFFDIVTAREVTWQPWVVMPAGTKDDYVGSWNTSRLRILLEGPFCRTWYLGERFVRQTLGLADPIVPAPPPLSMRTADSLPAEAIVTFMVGQDGDLHRGDGDYIAFIRTHLMPPLTRVRTGGAADVPPARGAIPMVEPEVGGAAPAVHVAGLPAIPTAITYWRPNGTAHQIPLEQPEEREYVRDLDVQQVPVGYVDGLLELVDSLVHMVRRREALLVYHGHQPLFTPVAPMAPPPATGRRDRRAPICGGGEGRGRGRDRGARSRSWSRDSKSRVQGASLSSERTLTDEDTKTRDTKEIASEHSESEDGDDDSGLESHSSGDSGADCDSDLEFRPRKRTKRAS